MFRKDSAKRMVSTLIENTGFVCGSIKDTLSEKDNIDWIKSSTRHMAGNLASKACHANGVGGQSSPETMEGHVFFQEEMEGMIGEEGVGETTSTETSPKRASRFAKVKKKRDVDDLTESSVAVGANTLVIGLCLSRRDVALGHADTVTRQTAFDFNELQDRDYNFVSSTDSSGWLSGGGEKGGGDDSDPKIAAPDKVHIPIIQINAENSAVADEIISALARGEVFIPHMAILPEALSVNGSSPPDLIVRFDCEKNDDANPEDWPNWCLEFLHNQLYDMFAPMGAQWTKRPFQITLARKVKWKTVKHMNKFFAHAEQVVNTWREKGPQYLQPPESTSFFGATHEEIARPHGIYLLRNGVPTNYFAPNFQPPYTTKVTRSLIRNVIHKSWDSKRRDWLLEPIPKSVGPLKVISTVFGCAAADNGQLSPVESHAVFDLTHDLESFDIVQENRKAQSPGRRRKERIENNATESLIKLAESPIRTPKENPITTAVPSDESFGISPKQCDTASMEETTAESTTDGLTQPSIESTTASSTQYSKSTMTSSRQSSRDERVEQELFSPVFSSQRRSPKRTAAPQKQVIREEKPVPVASKGVHHYMDQQQRNLYLKAEDSKAEKFAKTKVSDVDAIIGQFSHYSSLNLFQFYVQFGY
jgi:hypothetical protein